MTRCLPLGPRGQHVSLHQNSALINRRSAEENMSGLPASDFGRHLNPTPHATARAKVSWVFATIGTSIIFGDTSPAASEGTDI